MTRLKRETNPLPGERPGYLPQHYKDNDFEVTGKDNPLPVTDQKLSDLEIKLETISQQNAEIIEKLSNPLDTNAQLTGSNVEIVTVLNAVSVVANGKTGAINLGLDPKLHKEAWILISIDKQPWFAQTTGHLWSASNLLGGALYPPRQTNQITTHSTIVPAISLIMALTPASAYGLEAPDTISKAKEYAFITQNMSIDVTNKHASETATITIKVMKISK